MRLQQYINETTLSDRTKGQLKDYIASNCKPFLKEFGKEYIKGNFIYRGLKGQNVKTFRVKKARTDREPRFINKNLHKFMDKLGKKLFGWNIRVEGVFTGDHMKVRAYGQRNIFIPSGNYKYIWNPNTSLIYRLYDRYNYWDNFLKTCKKFDAKHPNSEKAKSDIVEALEKIKAIKDNIEYIYTNEYKASGLIPNSDKYQFEAIFKCKEYIVLPVVHSSELQIIISELIS